MIRSIEVIIAVSFLVGPVLFVFGSMISDIMNRK